MNALVHQTYTLSDGSFRVTKCNSVPREFLFNTRRDAVVMSPDSEGLGSAIETGVGSNLKLSQVVFCISHYTLFSASVMILGRYSFLKFV